MTKNIKSDIKTELFNYHLMAAEIVYTNKNEVFTHKFNTLMKIQESYINLDRIKETQQAVQVRFYKEIMPPSPDINVIDVFILGATHLGWMTDEQFNGSGVGEKPIEPKTEKPLEGEIETPADIASSQEILG